MQETGVRISLPTPNVFEPTPIWLINNSNRSWFEMEIYDLSKIGRILEVSDNAVRKRMKKLNLHGSAESWRTQGAVNAPHKSKSE